MVDGAQQAVCARGGAGAHLQAESVLIGLASAALALPAANAALLRMATATLACGPPAARAATVAPTEALRAG